MNRQLPTDSKNASETLLTYAGTIALSLAVLAAIALIAIMVGLVNISV